MHVWDACSPDAFVLLGFSSCASSATNIPAIARLVHYRLRCFRQSSFAVLKLRLLRPSALISSDPRAP
jgi:hypothetical protein